MARQLSYKEQKALRAERMNNVNNTVFNEVEVRICEILEQRENDAKARTKSIEDAKADVAEALEAMKKATQEDDLKGYYKAKDALDKANTSIEMRMKALDDLNNKPLITEEEYNSLINAVLDEIKRIDNENKAKVVKLIDELLIINDSNYAVIDKGNNILKSLQIDVHKDYDYYKKSNRDKYIYTDFSVATCANKANCGSYQKIKEELENNEGD